MNAIPLINNIPKSNINGNEKQLRQEINTSLVALKKEAGTLEGLISEALQILDEVNNRIATLENDTVKKNDVVNVVQSGNMNPVTSNAVADKINSLDVSSVGGDGKYISAISEADGKISATASDITSSVSSGNSQPVTSGGVAEAIIGNTIYNPCYNDYDTTFNIDTVGAGHRTYVASSVGGGTSGNCPSHYGVVHTITANGTAWKFQVAKETHSDTTYTRQNINDGGWTAWQPVLSGTWETLWSSGNSIIKGIVCNGKAFVTIHLQNFVCSSDFHLITTIAEKYRPRTVSRGYCFSAETPIIMGFVNIESNGNIYINTMNGKTVYGDSLIMIEKDV